MRARLAGLDDARASSALALIGARRPDLDGLAAIASGSNPQEQPGLVGLRQLAQLPIPAMPGVRAAAAEPRAAVSALAASSGTATATLDAQARLLRSAPSVHTQQGDMSCPVCGIGTLDADWAARSAGLLSEQEAALTDLRNRLSARAAARTTADTLVGSIRELGTCPDPALTGWPAAELAAAAWRDAPDDDLQLADHLERHVEPHIAAATLTAQAAELLTARQDAWTPAATELGNWVTQARRARDLEPAERLLKQALGWIKSNEAVLRNQRLAPLADRARRSGRACVKRATWTWGRSVWTATRPAAGRPFRRRSMERRPER